MMVAMVAVAAAWNINENNNEVSLSDLALENVEALASGEDITQCIIAYCYWSRYDNCDYSCDGVSYSSSNMRNK